MNFDVYCCGSFFHGKLLRYILWVFAIVSRHSFYGSYVLGVCIRMCVSIYIYGYVCVCECDQTLTQSYRKKTMRTASICYKVLRCFIQNKYGFSVCSRGFHIWNDLQCCKYSSLSLSAQSLGSSKAMHCTITVDIMIKLYVSYTQTSTLNGNSLSKIFRIYECLNAYGVCVCVFIEK